MSISPKKLGKAKIDLNDELWLVEGRTEKFHFNRRLVDTRSDVKGVKSKYAKFIQVNTPSMRKPNRREEHFKVRDDYKRDLSECLKHVYEEMLAESFTYPILLRRDKDFDHKIDWRYCLYQGYIYQFDHSGYSDEEMINQIQVAFPSQTEKGRLA
jgi:hypothetical protein